MVDMDFNDESFFARWANIPNRVRSYNSIIEWMLTAFNRRGADDK